MAKSTFQGVVRSYGGANKHNATPGVMVQSVQFSCDPTATGATNVRIGTSSSEGQTLTLPAGAIVMSVQTIGAAAGGTNPTVDLGGTVAGVNDPDGIIDELPVDVKGEITGGNGALVIAGGLAASTTVTANVGASAATSGTFTGILTYAIADDGTESV